MLDDPKTDAQRGITASRKQTLVQAHVFGGNWPLADGPLPRERAGLADAEPPTAAMTGTDPCRTFDPLADARVNRCRKRTLFLQARRHIHLERAEPRYRFLQDRPSVIGQRREQSC